MQNRIFFCVCFGFIVGVGLRSFWGIDVYLALLAGVLSLALILIFSLLKNKWGIVVSVFILASILGILRFDLVDRERHTDFTLIQGAGIIVDEPDVRENNQKLTVEIETDGQKDKILVTTNLGGDFKYGDEVKLEGKADMPENFVTDTGKEFDYINYLKKDGIFYVMPYPEIKVLSRGHGNPVKSSLFSFKNKFLEKINFAIPEPENTLMGGLILGERSSFSQSLRQKFIDTGTIHIVALSGYNISLVADWFMKIFSFLPMLWSIGAGALSILLFVLMTGGAATAVRAGIMAVLVLLARLTGRAADAGRALLLAAVIMIIFNPLILVYDVSFQLSVIATVAIIFLEPKIREYFTWIPGQKFREIISTTIAAYIFVLPFILYQMGTLSLVALPANILILPLIPLTMVLGFVTGFAGLVYYLLAVPIGFLAYLLLAYELKVVDFFADISFAAFSIPNFPLWLTALIYVSFIWWLFGSSLRQHSS